MAKAVTIVRTIRVGTPLRIPITIQGLTSSIKLPKVDVPQGELFYKLIDTWFQTNAANAPSFPDTVSIDESVLRLISDKTQRHKLLMGLIEDK